MCEVEELAHRATQMHSYVHSAAAGWVCRSRELFPPFILPDPIQIKPKSQVANRSKDTNKTISNLTLADFKIKLMLLVLN